MSIVARARATAARLLTAYGAPATFARQVAGTYDPITDTTADGTSLTWSAPAIYDVHDPATAVPGPSDRRVTTRALLVAGQSLARVPDAGDAVTFGSVTYSVLTVTPLGDVDGTTAPVYRCEVRA